MNSKYYCDLIQKNSESYNQYNTFIILYGTGTLTLTAAILTVFIGSEYSIFEDNRYSDARTNIQSTFEYACLVKRPTEYVCCKEILLDSTTYYRHVLLSLLFGTFAKGFAWNLHQKDNKSTS